ncbi:heat-inducible transcriptional repressor HrcA [Chryseomicrobium palamuruense]|uniref:Heat-inducible transcription repressor HrcA n=1 Tax=Chryseomicrobium palamuruense TaxID=682973 RepID=A0ABV8UXN5_9BACL
MLTERQILILQVTVDDFIQTAQPVGSRQLSKKELVPFSPATIRNEMADLEELGYLEKTHTSSGRIPSEKGYRYYVDHMSAPNQLSSDEMQKLHSIFEEKRLESEQIIRKSAEIIAELTTYTTILLGEDVQKHRVRKFSMVPLSSETAVSIIVTDHGHVQNRLVEIPYDFKMVDLERMVEQINQHVIGAHLYEIPSILGRVMNHLIEQHEGRMTEVFEALTQSISENSEEKVVYGGKMQLFNQPEFNDWQKARGILEFMQQLEEHPRTIVPNSSGLSIRIGSENNMDSMENCSIVTATYSFGEKQKGQIAIIGPMRMDYRRVISLLDYVTGDLSRELTRILHSK